MVDIQPTTSIAADVLARFWAKVRRDTDGCWRWTANRAGGRTGRRYGQFTVDCRRAHIVSAYAHRFSYELHHGPIPDGLEILHSCDNGLCVNPAHLSVGTHTDNMRDAASRRRLSVPRPRRQKVTTDQLALIDFLLSHGVKQAYVADRFGVSKAWMSFYARGLRRQYDRPQASPSQHPTCATANAAHPAITLRKVG